MNQQLKNKYEVLTLPIDYNQSFLELNREEIAKYYEWFLNIKSSRLNHLCDLALENNQICLQEQQLNIIENFLLNSVSVSPKSISQFNTEFEKVPLHLKRYAKPDNYILDKITISICYDIGIFLGELMIKLDGSIKWILETNDKYGDYGQPVLTKQNCKFEVNPFRVVKNAAAKIHEGRYSQGQLISFFNAWKKAFNVNDEQPSL